jgi:hypothetical protein
MKKLALFAMLLGSCLLYGCGETTPAKKPPANAPAAGAEGDKDKTPPATTETDKDKDKTPPAEPAK